MRRTLARLGGALSPLPILIACASGGSMGGDPNVITAPELSQSQAATAYDAIRQIRPEMLRNRDSGTLLLFSARRPVVAVDDSVAGGVDVLRALPTHEVGRIEYVSAWEAGKRYGPGFGNGLVLVARRTAPAPKLADAD
jgi:hypothetical protein